MRFLIVDTYYPSFLQSLYKQIPHLARQTYSQQLQVLLDQAFGTSDFYSSNLQNLGYEAKDIISNCEPLQYAWGREHGMRNRLILPQKKGNKYLLQILMAQIKEFKPDVLYMQNLNWPGSNFLREAKPWVKLIVGQIAYYLNPCIDLSSYDLILTSFPHFVDTFRQMGGNSEYFRIGFESTILSKIACADKIYQAVFVGSYSPSTGPHGAGTCMLEYLSTRTPIQFWGQGIESLPAESPIHNAYHGEAWGLDTYTIMSQTRIAFNRHVEWSENYANNMRLYEATGVGAMLLTDYKDNLSDLFEIGKEIVAYRSNYECVELIRYYTEHESERATIASAGQKRTLCEHTYHHRMEELVRIVNRYMSCTEKVKKNRFEALEQKPPSNEPTITNQAVALLKTLVRHTPLANPARRIYKKLRPAIAPADSYQSILHSSVTKELEDSWADPKIPALQRNVVNRELVRMYQGAPPRVFQAAHKALQATGMEYGSIIEIGCSNGYYYEVFEHLLGHKIDYTGVDYSEALITQARMEYPGISFLQGNTTHLLLPDASFDVVISGCVLLHVLDYPKGIFETARIARKWCIFHRTPVMPEGETCVFTKTAYDVPMVELVFGEKEILELFRQNDLELIEELTINVSERDTMKTYVCRKKESD